MLVGKIGDPRFMDVPTTHELEECNIKRFWMCQIEGIE
jgi:hypothetical protein